MLIAFAGCDGAGKSVHSRAVVAWLRSEGRDVEFVDRWDIHDRERFPECRFLGGPLSELRQCIAEMQDPMARAMFLFWTMRLTIMKRDLSAPGRIYVTDSYWMKHAAVEIVYGCDPAWVEKTVQAFPRPDLTFYLDVEPEDALRRKPDLNSYECGGDLKADTSSFLAHQAKVRALLVEWSRRYGWEQVSTHRASAEVVEDLKARLRPHVGLR